MSIRLDTEGLPALDGPTDGQNWYNNIAIACSSQVKSSQVAFN